MKTLSDLFRGSRVRLAALDAERDAPTLARWSLDSEYLRLLDSDPARPRTAKHWQDDLTGREGKDNNFPFGIRTLGDDRLIGFVGLWVLNWGMGEAGVGIGLGERDYWGRGFGTEAMRLAVRYAFAELNLARVSLEAFAYNTRAIRAYEKAGFSLEGRQREWMRREGQRHDVVHMGILRDASNGGQS